MKRSLVGLLLLFTGIVAAKTSIEYDSVAAALSELKAKPDTKTQNRDGWTFVTESVDGAFVMWTFTPHGHPAHPSVVKRRIFEEGESVRLEMRVLCESVDPVCDGLVEDFNALNQGLVESIKARKKASQ